MNILADVLSALNAHGLSEPWTSSRDFNIRKLQIKCQKMHFGLLQILSCNLFHHNIRLIPHRNNLSKTQHKIIFLITDQLFYDPASFTLPGTAQPFSIQLLQHLPNMVCVHCLHLCSSPLCCSTVYRSGLSVKLEQCLASLMQKHKGVMLQ